MVSVRHPLRSAVAVLESPMTAPPAAIRLSNGAEPAEIRRATVADAPAIHALINANLAEGHLLPRTAEDVTRRAARFLVVTVDDAVVGCAELAPLSRAVAEVRSLVVDESTRGRGGAAPSRTARTAGTSGSRRSPWRSSRAATGAGRSRSRGGRSGRRCA